MDKPDPDKWRGHIAPSDAHMGRLIESIEKGHAIGLGTCSMSYIQGWNDAIDAVRKGEAK